MRWSRSSSRSARAGAAAPVALAAALAGCLVVPVPERATSELGRAEQEGRLDTLVRPGEPIADLLLRLGEPDAVSLDGTALAYRWERVWAYFVALVPAGAGPAPAPALLPVAGALDTERALVVELAEGRVGAARVVATGSRLGQAFGADPVRPWGVLTLFRATRYRGEPVELAARAAWRPPGSDPSFAYASEVLIVITPSGVHLKAPGAFGPAPADLALRFAAMRDARLERPALLPPWIRLEMEGGLEHGLRLADDGEGSWAERNEQAWRRIEARLRPARSAPAPRDAPAPRSR